MQLSNTFGRVIGIIGGTLGAIAAIPSIGGNYPWWSRGVFTLCVYVVHGIVVYGPTRGRSTRPEPRTPTRRHVTPPPSDLPLEVAQ
ncbi:MAG TPA: hypothetical protein VH276_01715 [Solirubrobacteraceae bacterium]|nr:hypothetical protein [Solirubrobacteraceae bacterium]